jgi:hypothetical protein
MGPHGLGRVPPTPTDLPCLLGMFAAVLPLHAGCVVVAFFPVTCEGHPDGERILVMRIWLTHKRVSHGEDSLGFQVRVLSPGVLNSPDFRFQK